jgi:predicted nuclease of predicted toxin-antitoxin system
MKLLLDECLPRKLKHEFVGHEVYTIDEVGFKGLKNGQIIQSASQDEFEVFVSVDKNIEHQQNKANLPLAILVLSAKTNRLESLLPLMTEALKVLANIQTGEIGIIENKD